jgi:hypothetical protein
MKILKWGKINPVILNSSERERMLNGVHAAPGR